jgi:hypothetical protein
MCDTITDATSTEEAYMARRTHVQLALAATALAAITFTTTASTLLAQRAGGAGQAPAAAAAAEPQETTPPLLFKEEFQQVAAAQGVPTSPRRSNNQYYLAAQSAVKNPNVELRLYGAEAKNLTVYLHEGRADLWTGLVGSPIAVLLKHRGSFMDLTGLARVRAIVRTGNLHRLNPAIRLADGTLAAGDRAIDTNGEFLQVEVAFANQRWYTIEPDTLAVKGLLQKVDLARVDEVGFVDLAAAGGHGSSGWANISHIEVFAKPVAR